VTDIKYSTNMSVENGSLLENLDAIKKEADSAMYESKHEK
jgi:hypothetical protein